MSRIALSLALAASTLSGATVADANHPQAAEATVQCITAYLTGSAQVHRNAAGDYFVTAFAPRKVASRWKIAASGGEITMLSGRAGADRSIRAACGR